MTVGRGAECPHGAFCLPGRGRAAAIMAPMRSLPGYGCCCKRRSQEEDLMRSLRAQAISAMIPLATLLGGCIAHITGSVTVDDVPFVATDCRSGAAYGGWGVEVFDPAGRRLRMGANLDGSLGVALFQQAWHRGNISARVERWRS